ncbi:MAG: hypothetical protein EBX49_01535 [Synechococcaceae bacterium WB8_1B_136]|nr:hypothetical protein [Synechococcaceae bacterium WB8_1B_136]
MVHPIPNRNAAIASVASERITEELGRLLPLVNSDGRVARVDSASERTALSSLLSWDNDGQLSVD